MKIIKIIMTIIPLLLMFNLQAEIFKCTNTKGAVYYNDKPCPLKDKQKKMKAEKDVVKGYVPETESKKSKRATERKEKMSTTTAVTDSDRKRENKEDGLSTENDNKSENKNKNTVASKQGNKNKDSVNTSRSNKTNNSSLDSSSTTQKKTSNSSDAQAEAINERELIDMLAGQTFDKPSH